MWKERIEKGKIGRIDLNIGRCGKLALGGHALEDLLGTDRFARGQEVPQGIVEQIEPFVLGRVQQLQVLLDGRGFAGVAPQLVVGHTEPRGRIHVVHVLIVNEGPGLAHQRVDHVTKVDRFLAAAELSGDALQALVLIPKLQMVLVDTHQQLQADVLAADRIHISLHANDTIGLDRQRNASARALSLRRQGVEGGGFLAKQFLARCIAPRCQLTQEAHIVLDAVEVPTSAQPQRLVHGVLEVTVRGLDVSILMGLGNVNPMALQTVVIKQIRILSGEFFVARKVVHRGRQTVTANPTRDTARPMQGILQARREGLEGLRMTEVNVFPVGIREDRVKQHVLEGFACDGNVQRIHHDEVKGDHVARMVNLREHDLLLHPVLELPTPHSPLEGSPDRVGHARLPLGRVVLLLQPIQDGVRLESLIVLKSLFDFAPKVFQWIRPSAVSTRGPFDLTW